MKEKLYTTIYIEKSERDKLKILSEKLDRSVSYLLRQAIKDLLNKDFKLEVAV